MTTVFVHGFWGSPADWTPTLHRLPLGRGTWCPDLYRDEGLTPEVEPLAWADRFVHRLRAHCGPAPVDLVAYSMGGRLALHALLRVPGLFRRALILSSAPTLDAAAVATRREFDESWARRFTTDPWESLEADWDRQPVLNTSSAVVRRHDDDLRAGLADSLRNWSPRHHAFTAADLRKISPNVDFAFGASDQKYVGVAKQLQELPVGGQISIIPHAGHRLPQDAPDFIARWASEEIS